MCVCRLYKMRKRIKENPEKRLFEIGLNDAVDGVSLLSRAISDAGVEMIIVATVAPRLAV